MLKCGEYADQGTGRLAAVEIRRVGMAHRFSACLPRLAIWWAVPTLLASTGSTILRIRERIEGLGSYYRCGSETVEAARDHEFGSDADLRR